jgi:minor extracellular serine protease Vpr
MRARAIVACVVALLLGAVSSPLAVGEVGPRATRPASRADGFRLPEGFVPAVARTTDPGVYLVQLRAPSLAARIAAHGTLAPSVQRDSVAAILRTQDSAVAAARALGGEVRYRFARSVNAFSAFLTPADASRIAALPDVVRVVRASRVSPSLRSSVPFIGAPRVWKDHGARGRGVVVAVIDSGIDYTHANFGGSGVPGDYNSNNPSVIEPGSFPTAKVVGGFDLVGDRGYDPFDDDPTNDRPSPDPDPLDRDDTDAGGHGSHVAGICCGRGVRRSIGKGVAPLAKLMAFKVFDEGATTADVVIAAIERAIDPNGDGNTRDAADVINMSLGEDYTVSDVDAEALAAVDEIGTIVVSSAGNASNQPNLGSAYVAGTPGNVPTVIGVASMIDQFEARRLTVVQPAGIELPAGGPVVFQDWSVPYTDNITTPIVDAREFDPPADPTGQPAPTDRILCDSVPRQSPFANKIALIFKGPQAEGDCFVEDKVINAQQAGAIAVVLWDGFGGIPSVLGTGGNESQVTIPVVDLSGTDSEVIAATASPNAPATYNDVEVWTRIGATATVIPGYEDRLSSFTSEGPTRYTSALKPDISAPGDAITSTQAGSGTGSLTIGGSSMASPHVAGVAALLREIHPNLGPQEIKALLMNQATHRVRNLDGTPAPATVMGAGRVRADRSADAVSLATPGSLSLGLRAMARRTVVTRSLRVKNMDDARHGYRVTAGVRYFDFDPAIARIEVGPSGGPFRDAFTFGLAPGRSKTFFVRFTLDPRVITAPEQLYGWYYFHPNVDGQVIITQRKNGKDQLRVPWHVAPLAASDDTMTPGNLNLTAGSAQLALSSDPAAGVPFADLYLLGDTDRATSGLEDDVVAIGARSFTGSRINGTPEGVPTARDPLLGLTWLEFLTQVNTPNEPVEFVVQSAGVHSISDMVETDVLIDVGADGSFADPQLGADAVLVKVPGFGSAGTTCLFILPSTFETCNATYFADYTVYNSTLTGVAVDARALGLSNSTNELAYSVTQCSGFAESTEIVTCETVGEIDPATRTYSARLDVTNPALRIAPLVCGGFFGGAACTGSTPVTVTVGSAQPGDDPEILVAFPNNPPNQQTRVISTTT